MGWPAFGGPSLFPRRDMEAILLAILALGSLWGKEIYVIGEEEHPWEEVGTLENLDVSTEPGWIRVVYLDSTENLVLWMDPKDIYGVRPIPNTQISDRDKVSMVDGDPTTAFVHRPEWDPYSKTWFTQALQFDLGRLLPVYRIRFSCREEFRNHLIRKYEVRVAEEFPGLGRWSYMADVEPIAKDMENIRTVVDITFPPRPVRFVGIRPLMPTEIWEVAEVEVYGKGYLPSKARFTSKVIHFDSPAAWGRIWWKGWREEGAKVEIQTRSGTDDTPDVYWRKTGVGDEQVWWSESGRPLTKEEYYAMKPDRRGRITHDFEHWSFWSAPYDFEEGLKGVPIVSPAPRPYFQVRVTITPTNYAGAGLDFIAFEFSTKVPAYEVLAEVDPCEVRPGEKVSFTYALRPRIKDGNTGFDHLKVRTPTRPDVKWVKIDGEEVAFEDDVYDDGFVVSFPKVDRDQSLLEVGFDCSVLGYTRFDGWVWDGSSEELPIFLQEGDALRRLPGNTLSVRISLKEPVLSVVDASRVVTPNGDDEEDTFRISYRLLKLTKKVPVTLKIYDISGRLLKEERRIEGPQGVFSRWWDGRDGEGNLVPPGVYIYRLSADTDEGVEERTGSFVVAY